MYAQFKNYLASICMLAGICMAVAFFLGNGTDSDIAAYWFYGTGIMRNLIR